MQWVNSIIINTSNIEPTSFLMCSYTWIVLPSSLKHFKLKTKLNYTIVSVVRIPLNGYNLVNYWCDEARHVSRLMVVSCKAKKQQARALQNHKATTVSNLHTQQL